jgi:osmotically-inducible protein OsmY
MSLDDDIESRHEWQTSADPMGRATDSPSRELRHGALGRLSRDDLVQQDICAALIASRGLTHGVEVEMTTEGVTLRGTVATERDRRRALVMAAKVAGCRPVRDELVLSQSDETGPRSLGTASGQRCAT